MTAKEALNNITTISEILVEVSKSHIMSNKAINEIRKLDIGEIYFTLRQTLTELEAIKSKAQAQEKELEELKCTALNYLSCVSNDIDQSLYGLDVSKSLRLLCMKGSEE